MKFLDLGGVQYIGREAFNNSACESIVLPDSVRYVGSNAFSAPYIRAIHLNDGLRALDEGAFFTYGKGSGVTIPASVTYIGAQALGWCPDRSGRPVRGPDADRRLCRHRHGRERCAGLRRGKRIHLPHGCCLHCARLCDRDRGGDLPGRRLHAPDLRRLR